MTIRSPRSAALEARAAPPDAGEIPARSAGAPGRAAATAASDSEANPQVRRAKIVGTLGPASDSAKRIEALIDAGLNVARLNFSHGTREEHVARIRRVREAATRLGRGVALLQDLTGPRIRAGDMQGGKARLVEGAVVRLTNEEVLGTAERMPTSHRDLPREVAPGDDIFLDDGLLQLRVEEVQGEEVICRVVRGGILRSHKGMNLPGVEVAAPSVTPKDEEDVRLGLEHGVDLIALSFVRRAADVAALKALIAQAGREVPVIAKLEKPQAVANLEEILAAADGVMIARGDLGVELPPERVPIIQKRIIQRANATRKLVIVATQMLNSMTEHVRPTRAETSDVSNAILDGADAVMLSSETASGKHPLEAVQMMDRIIRAAEEHQFEKRSVERVVVERDLTFTDAICDAACSAALETDARLVACFTQSGKTVAILSKYRPRAPIAAFTPFPAARNAMAILWGVEAYVMDIPANIDRLIDGLDMRLLEEGLARRGETVVIVCGAPLDVPGRTNLLKLHTVGDVRHHLT